MISPRPPTADAERPALFVRRIANLLRDLQWGRVRLPPLPRDSQWQQADALALFDSIYRGYPIGMLVFWQTSAVAAGQSLGHLRLPSGQLDNALWVVDGQQRLAVLARVLLADAADPSALALAFDLDAQQFVTEIPAGAAADPDRWMPLTAVLDTDQWAQCLARFPTDKHARRQRAEALGRLIRDYQVPAYLTRTQDESMVLEMLERLSQGGHPLPLAQVRESLFGLRSPDGRLSIDDVANQLAGTGFGHIANRELVTWLEMIRDHQPPADDKPCTSPQVSTPGDDEQTLFRLAGHVVAFLMQNVGIPRIELLPQAADLRLLGAFFRQHPAPEPRTRELLARWFWRAALDTEHRRGLASRQHPGQLVAGSEHAAVQRLLAGVRRQPAPRIDRFQFDLRFAESRLALLALFDLKPRHLVTGALVQPEELLADSGHLRASKCIGGFPGPLGDKLANRLVHPGPSPRTRDLANCHSALSLESHGICEQAIALLRRGEHDAFLALRAERLQCQLDAFFARKTRWDESDRPALSALLID